MATVSKQSPQRWESIKPIFLRLYLEEEKPLNDVMRELEDKHQFVATTKAFKTHIAQWQAFKNYKASVKQKLARHKAALSETESSDLQLILRGKPVKWDRVDRYVTDTARRRRRQVPYGRRPPDPLRSQQSKPTQGHIASDSFRSMSRTLSDSDELLLSSARECVWWHLRAPIYTHWLHEVTYGLEQAVQGLSLEPHKAWRQIHRLCESMPSAITKDPYGLMRLMNLISTGMNHKVHGSLVNTMFSYVRGLSTKLLPNGNPLKDFLSRVDTVQIARRFNARIIWLKFGIHWKAFRQTGSSDPTLANLLIDDLYDMVFLRGFKDAMHFGSKLLGLIELPPLQRLKLGDLTAYAYHAEGHYEKAIAVGEQTLLCAAHSETGLSTTAAVYKTIARARAVTGERYLSADAYRKAADLYLTSEHRSRALACLRELHATLEDMDRWAQAQLLREEYNLVLATIESNGDQPTQGRVQTLNYCAEMGADIVAVTTKVPHTTGPDISMVNMPAQRFKGSGGMERTATVQQTCELLTRMSDAHEYPTLPCVETVNEHEPWLVSFPEVAGAGFVTGSKADLVVAEHPQAPVSRQPRSPLPYDAQAVQGNTRWDDTVSFNNTLESQHDQTIIVLETGTMVDADWSWTDIAVFTADEPAEAVAAECCSAESLHSNSVPNSVCIGDVDIGKSFSWRETALQSDAISTGNSSTCLVDHPAPVSPSEL